MRVWWNGIHIRLKIWRLIDWGFKSLHSYQYGYSIMDNTVGFYPTNVGSIPASRARDNVSGASWTGTGLQTHGSRFDSYHSLQIVVDLQDYLRYNSCSSKVLSESWLRNQAWGNVVWLLQFAYNLPYASLVVLVKNYHHARFVYRLGHCPFTAGRRGSIPPSSTRFNYIGLPKPVGGLGV